MSEGKMNNGVSEAGTENKDHIKSFGSLRDSRFNKHFTYHKPNENSIPRYNNINEAAKKFAEVVCRNLPESAEKEAALIKIIEVKMTCNSFIATNPELYTES